MKGIIFNLLETLVTDARGEEEWDEILDASGLAGTYTALGTYPDADLSTLVSTVAERWKWPADDVLRWFGQSAMPQLAASYSTFFTGHDSVTTFLPTINDVIHAEVKKLYPEAETPTFDVSVGADDTVTLAYGSARQLCALAEGFVLGAADQFHESVVVEHASCVKRGDAGCVLVCRVRP